MAWIKQKFSDTANGAHTTYWILNVKYWCLTHLDDTFVLSTGRKYTQKSVTDEYNIHFVLKCCLLKPTDNQSQIDYQHSFLCIVNVSRWYLQCDDIMID